MAKTLVENDNAVIETVRNEAELTTSYESEIPINISGCNQVQLFVAFTIGSLTDAKVKLEYSNDGSSYYQESMVEEFPALGIITQKIFERKITASGNYIFSVPVLGRWLRVSVKGTGTTTGSSIAIKSCKGNI